MSVFYDEDFPVRGPGPAIQDYRNRIRRRLNYIAADEASLRFWSDHHERWARDHYTREYCDTECTYIRRSISGYAASNMIDQARINELEAQLARGSEPIKLCPKKLTYNSLTETVEVEDVEGIS